MSTAALGRKAEAATHLAGALELDPTRVGIRSQLATLAFEKGEKDRAVTLLRQEMELAPAEAAPAINLGIILAGMGRKEEAVRAFEHAITVAPTSRPVHGTRHSVHRLGPGIESRGDSAKRESVAKPDPRSWFDIGANYSNRGEDDKAEEAYKKALQIDPAFPDATRELDSRCFAAGIFRGDSILGEVFASAPERRRRLRGARRVGRCPKERQVVLDTMPNGSIRYFSVFEVFFEDPLAASKPGVILLTLRTGT